MPPEGYVVKLKGRDSHVMGRTGGLGEKTTALTKDAAKKLAQATNQSGKDKWEVVSAGQVDEVVDQLG